MFNKMKKALTAIIAAALLAGCASRNKPWMTLSPGYATERDVATVRVEGGTQLSERLSFYGFSDIEGTPDKPADAESVYMEGRLIYSLGELDKALEHAGVVLEYNGGTGFKDFFRMGLSYNAHLWDGNFTALRILPFETSGDAWPQAGVYSAQTIGDLTLSILGEYNIEPRTLYTEIEAAYNISDTFSIFLQGRGFGGLDDIDLEPVMGIRYTLKF